MNAFRRVLICAAISICTAGAAPTAAVPGPAQPKADRRAAERAADALSNYDHDRAAKDPAYAREILAHLDRFEPLADTSNPDVRGALAVIRLSALDALDRDAEVLERSKRFAAAGPAVPPVYVLGIYAAAELDKPADALTLTEAAARHLTDAQELAAFREMVPEALVRAVFQGFYQAEDDSSRRRFSEALLTLNWPSPDDAGWRDSLRSGALDARLERGDVAGARTLAAEISAPGIVIELVASRRYDVLFPPGADRVALVKTAAETHERDTQARLRAKPGDLELIHERGQALRGLGREEEALSLLLPHASNIDAVEKGGTYAFWIVNEAAYALAALGRGDEAVKLMEQLLTLDMKKHGDLINMAINHGEVLNSVGRHKEAAAYSAQLDARAEGFTSPYGFMWIWSNAACGHALGGDVRGASPWIERLAAASKDNRAAHMRALLCVNDLDAAERLLVTRLEGPATQDVLRALQDYRIGSHASAARRLLEERLKTLRERPAVQAAIAKSGRILSLPLSKTYWGDY